MNKKRISVLVALMLLLTFSVFAAEKVQKKPAFRTIKVQTVIGSAQIDRRGLGHWKPLKSGIKIRQRDRIRTEKESSVEFVFENGTTLTMEESSELNLARLEGDEKSISQTHVALQKGSLLFNVQKLVNKKSDFVFETLTATAAIRGTKGGLETDGSETAVWLHEGLVDLVNRKTQVHQELKEKQFAIQEAKGFNIRKFADKTELKKFRKTNKERLQKRLLKKNKNRKNITKKVRNIIKNNPELINQKEVLKQKLIEKVKSGEITRQEAETLIQKTLPPKN